MRKLLVLLLVLLGVGPALAADEGSVPYYIPPSQFNAAMQIMDLGFSNVFALFQSATGSFSFEESTKSVSHVRLAIDTSSLMANSPDNQKDLVALLDVAHFQEIRFSAPESFSFAEGKADLKGNLTLHGVTKPVVFQATLNHVGKSPRAGGMWASEGQAIGLSLKGSIKRADFGMADDPEMPGRFGDTIMLMLETQAMQQ